MTALISIIVPNFNHALYLPDRLNSIFNQTYQNFEVIILDDASQDNSLDLLKAYKNHPKVSHYIVNKENTGSPFKQWKKGLELAKGDFIWIAESDDFCSLDFLETQVEMLKKAEVTVALTKIFSNKAVGKTVAHPVFNKNKLYADILYCPILNVSSVLFKSSLIKNLSASTFANYRIIGDIVFYFEFFKGTRIHYNNLTINYFRRDVSGVSDLDNRSFNYLKTYFNEHCRFIRYAQKEDSSINNEVVSLYIKKFYNRVANRVSRVKKIRPSYLYLFIKFKLKLHILG